MLRTLWRRCYEVKCVTGTVVGNITNGAAVPLPYSSLYIEPGLDYSTLLDGACCHACVRLGSPWTAKTLASDCLRVCACMCALHCASCVGVPHRACLVHVPLGMLLLAAHCSLAAQQPQRARAADYGRTFNGNPQEGANKLFTSCWNDTLARPRRLCLLRSRASRWPRCLIRAMWPSTSLTPPGAAGSGCGVTAPVPTAALWPASGPARPSTASLLTHPG